MSRAEAPGFDRYDVTVGVISRHRWTCAAAATLIAASACRLDPNAAARDASPPIDARDAAPADAPVDAVPACERVLPVIVHRFRSEPLTDAAVAPPQLDLGPLAGAGPTLVAGGVDVSGNPLGATQAQSAAFGQAALDSSSFAVEIYVTSASDVETGPGRLIAFATDPLSDANFVIGQEGTSLKIRLFTSETASQTTEVLTGVFGDTSLGPHQIVIDFNGTTGEAAIFVDGSVRRIIVHEVETGVPATLNWTLDGFGVTVGDEQTLDRPWNGVVHYLALYDRPMDREQPLCRYDEFLDSGGLL